MNTKTLIAIVIAFVLGSGASFLALNQSSTEDSGNAALVISEDNPYERISAIDAYYEGEKIWFLHTDVSDEKMAKSLGAMVNYNTVYSPALGEFPEEAVGTFYVFMNGISQKGVKPWGGGPFGYQIDIFDSIPGDPQYIAIRSPRLVTWTEEATPRILTSVAELLKAEESGEVSIKQAGFNVNVPVVKWPGDYLGGQSSIEGNQNNMGGQNSMEGSM